MTSILGTRQFLGFALSSIVIAACADTHDHSSDNPGGRGASGGRGGTTISGGSAGNAGTTTAGGSAGAKPWDAVEWVEQGGPPIVGPPARRGFGLRLLERGLAMQKGMKADIHFEPDGLHCILHLPPNHRVLPDRGVGAL